MPANQATLNELTAIILDHFDRAPMATEATATEGLLDCDHPGCGMGADWRLAVGRGELHHACNTHAPTILRNLCEAKS